MDIHLHDSADQPALLAAVNDNLERFANRLTRVDVFLHDENGEKGGIDQHCVLEARPRGLDPLVTRHQAPSPREAVVGAASKLERLLEHRFGRLDRHRG